jgi:hypothetical protein
VFVQSFSLTAQGLDGDPVYLLDELRSHRLELVRKSAAHEFRVSEFDF